MRIIAGNLRGSSLHITKNKNTRPLKDLARESIFNLLTHSNKVVSKLEKSSILDLYAGTGSFGLECLSRGSSNLIFVESYKEVLPVLKRNITSINCQENSVIYEKDIIKNFDFKIIKDKIDIIFMDPPYKEKSISQLLTKIDESKILSSNGIIIIHRHKKEEDLFPENFNIIEKKSYGISKVIFGCF